MRDGSKVILILSLAALAIGSAQAQIPYVTVRTPRYPTPPMALIQTNQSPAGAPAAAPAPVRVVPAPTLPPRKPSLDKAELERRVIRFQEQRAQEGSASAQYALGMRFLKGNGVEKNLATAKKWLTLAAEGGSTEARRELGRMTRQ